MEAQPAAASAIEPFWLGVATAKFVDPDPETWFHLAVDAGFNFGIWNGGFYIAQIGGDDDRREFLQGWLCGTQTRYAAIKAWLVARRIWGVWDGVLYPMN